jgi:autotransporter translocation and assembly factor TamB
VSIIFDETDLYPYFKMASQLDLSGVLTGKVEAKGNVDAMDNLEFSADLSKLSIFFKEKELVHTQDFKASFEEKEFSIPALHLLILKEGKVDIKGKGKLNGPLALHLEGHIPLEVARPFVDDLADISGDLLLSATIGGTQEHPEINAKITLESIGLTVPVLQQRLHGLNGHIQITPQTVIIDQIEGRLDTGRFDLAGKIDLDAFQPVKVFVDLNTNALPLQVPDMLDMMVTTELKFHGNREKSKIEGDVVILEGTYYKDVNLSLIQAVRQKKREEAPLPKEISQPFLKNTSLDISVKRRNPFLVDNNLALLEITPDLRISGNLNNPIISGRATVESGELFYQKKTFVVKKGFIDFLNPYKIEPTLDIKSEVEIRNWMINLEISGTPDQLIFRLTSDPPEEDGDIISLLLLGKTTRELIEGEGGSSQSTAQTLAKLISSTFGEDIKGATGLDILEVETRGEGDEDTSERIKVTIGKKLSKRTTVKYTTETEYGEIGRRGVAEYKFLENIVISGFQDSRGLFGGELQFRLEFR